MRQHILRLLVVLALVVGIGVVVYFIVRDNTPFVPNVYITNNINEDAELKTNLSNLNSKVNLKFEEDAVVYNIYNETSKYYASLLINVELSKEEANEIKNLYKNYRTKADSLIFSTNSLIDYIALEDQNTTELAGRKEKVNTDFNALNKSYYNIVSHLENVVNTKIYGGKNNNVLGVLKSTVIVLTNIYNENRNNFNFLSAVNEKLLEFTENNCDASDDAVKYVIKYNQLEKQTIINDFKNYFSSNTTSDDLNILINFLNSEVYYEKV